MKNVSRSALGDKYGRIHMMPQNFEKLNTGRKVKALRNNKPKSNDNNKIENNDYHSDDEKKNKKKKIEE